MSAKWKSQGITTVRQNIAAVVGVSCLFGTGISSADSMYRLEDIGSLGGSYTRGNAINDQGQVTGYSRLPDGVTAHAILYSEGQPLLNLQLSGDFGSGIDINDSGLVAGGITDNIGPWDYAFTAGVDQPLRLLGWFGQIPGSYSRAINDAGQVVGISYNHDNQTQRAFLANPGQPLLDLGTLGGRDSLGRDINNQGQVTGSAWTVDDRQHAFIFTEEVGMVDLGTLGGQRSDGYRINDLGQVTGVSQTIDGYWHAFLVSPESPMVDLETLGGNESWPTDINNLGQVTGYAQTSEGYMHAFVSGVAGIMEDLGTLGGRESVGLAINIDGVITGRAMIADGSERAFIYLPGQPMRDLNDLIDPSELLQPYVTLHEGKDINSRGQVLAHGCDNRTLSCGAYVVTPTNVTDPTPPEVSVAVAGTIGANDWYVSDVLLEWTVRDRQSQISAISGCDKATITQDTAGTTITCSATSAGGTTSRSVTIKRDAGPPTASAVVWPVANSDGWHNENVTVDFRGADSVSGGVTCDPPVLLSAEGVNQSASGRCFDAAGNQSSLATASGIRIDKTPPSVVISSPIEATFRRKTKLVARYSCTDGLAGIVTCEGTVANGQILDTSKKVNNATITVHGLDRAGNTSTQTVTYSVK